MFNKSTTNTNKKVNRNQYKEYRLESSNFTVDRSFKMENGQYGLVYAVRDGSGKLYAAKILKTDKTNYTKNQSVEEINNLLICQHPGIIKFYGYSKTDINGEKNNTIYMDYAKNGCLSDYITIKEGESKITNTQLQIILIGIAYGMKLMHKKQIIHLDLKPQNVLLDENFHPLIIDFGCSEKIESNTSNKDCKGTISYAAPEVLASKDHNYKADVYSFGILMYEIVSRKFAYSKLQKGKMTQYKLADNVREGIRPRFKPRTKKRLKKLIKRCWDPDQKNRPDFEEIFERLSENNKAFKSDINEDDDKYGDSDDEYSDGEYKDDDSSDNEYEENDDNNQTTRYHLKNVDLNEIRKYVKSLPVDQNESKTVSEFNTPRRKVNQVDYDALKCQYDILQKKMELQNTNYQEQVKDLNHLNDEYREKIDELEKENKKLKSDLKSLHEENKKLKSDFESLSEENEKIDELEKENRKLKSDLKSLHEENKELKSDLESLHEENEKIDKLEKENKKLKSDLISLQEEKDEQIDKLENKNKEAEKENRDLEDQINILEFEKNSFSGKNKNLVEENRKLNEKIGENEILIANLLRENENLNKHKDDNINVIENLRNENKNLKKSNNDLQYINNKNNNLAEKNITLAKSQDCLLDQIKNLKIENLQLKTLTPKQKKTFKRVQLPPITTDKLYEKMNSSVELYKECLISGFNSIDLISQQSFLTEAINISKSLKLKKIFTNFNNILNYLLNLEDIPERTNLIQIATDKISETCSEDPYKNLNRIYIRYELTQILYDNNKFISQDLIKLLDGFEDKIIEIKYPSDLFNDINNVVIGALGNVKISIFFSGEAEETDLFFKGNKKIDYLKIDTNIKNIKGGVMSGSFSLCTFLKKVYLSPSVELIGSFAFSYCTYLTEITIPESVKTIQTHAFIGCQNLKRVKIDKSLRSIESHIFFGCTSLDDIEIPTSLTSIKKQTFYNCKSLSKIVIPCKINLIEEEAFCNCSSLKRIKFASPDTENNGDVVGLIIEKNAFRACDQIEGIRFPSHLDKIKSYAFADCKSLIALTFVSEPSSIDKNAFIGCPISEITVPKKIAKMFTKSKLKEYGIKTEVAVYPE